MTLYARQQHASLSDKLETSEVDPEVKLHLQGACKATDHCDEGRQAKGCVEPTEIRHLGLLLECHRCKVTGCPLHHGVCSVCSKVIAPDNSMLAAAVEGCSSPHSSSDEPNRSAIRDLDASSGPFSCARSSSSRPRSCSHNIVLSTLSWTMPVLCLRVQTQSGLGSTRHKGLGAALFRRLR